MAVLNEAHFSYIISKKVANASGYIWIGFQLCSRSIEYSWGYKIPNWENDCHS